MKLCGCGLKDGFYRRIPNSATGNKRAQKKALGTLFLYIVVVPQALNARSLRMSKDPAHSKIRRKRATFGVSG